MGGQMLKHTLHRLSRKVKPSVDGAQLNPVPGFAAAAEIVNYRADPATAAREAPNVYLQSAMTRARDCRPPRVDARHTGTGPSVAYDRVRVSKQARSEVLQVSTFCSGKAQD